MPGAKTPTTVYGAPSILSCLPTMLGRSQTSPKLVDQHYDSFFPGDSLLGKKIAAVLKLHAHHLVHARCGELAFHVFRLVLGGEVKATAGPGVQGLERLALVPPVHIILRGYAVAITLDLGPYDHQLVGFRVRHGRSKVA